MCLGCSSFDATLIATMVSELARTIVAGQWQGQIVLEGKRKNTGAQITISTSHPARGTTLIARKWVRVSPVTQLQSAA